MSDKNVMRQLDVGSYCVRASTEAGSADVGRVFAEGTNGKYIIEHWVLFEGYRSPNLDQSMLVEATAEPFDCLASFFQAMRQRAEGAQTVTYIKASCEYQDSIPDQP